MRLGSSRLTDAASVCVDDFDADVREDEVTITLSFYVIGTLDDIIIVSEVIFVMLIVSGLGLTFKKVAWAAYFLTIVQPLN